MERQALGKTRSFLDKGLRWRGLRLSALALTAVCSLGGCTCNERASPPVEKEMAVAEDVTPTSDALAVPVEDWGELPRSAYRADLYLSAENLYVVTEHEIVRFEGKGRSFRRPLSLGPVRTRYGENLLYWKDGLLRTTPLRGGAERVLGALAQTPMQLLGSRNDFAWLVRGSDGVSVQTLRGGEVRDVLATPRPIVRASLVDDWVFFVEQLEGSHWRIGGAVVSATRTQVPVYSREYEGRAPAMLAVADALYFYDGPSRAVRRLSLDLRQEEIFKEGIICSPLAVFSHRVYCASVAGLFAVEKNNAPQRIFAEQEGPISSVAADARGVAWLTDRGADLLGVRFADLANAEL